MTLSGLVPVNADKDVEQERERDAALNPSTTLELDQAQTRVGKLLVMYTIYSYNIYIYCILLSLLLYIVQYIDSTDNKLLNVFPCLTDALC